MSNDTWLATRDGSVAVLFTDIVGSTEMLDRLGEEPWLEALRSHNSLVRSLVHAHGGIEIKFLGDGWMIVFADTVTAVRCAIAIQEALAELARSDPDGAFAVRIGVHMGHPVKEGSDFIGRDVIVASRLAHRAGPGEILCSPVVRLAAGGGDVAFETARSVDLKGLGTHEAFPVKR